MPRRPEGSQDFEISRKKTFEEAKEKAKATNKAEGRSFLKKIFNKDKTPVKAMDVLHEEAIKEDKRRDDEKEEVVQEDKRRDAEKRVDEELAAMKQRVEEERAPRAEESHEALSTTGLEYGCKWYLEQQLKSAAWNQGYFLTKAQQKKISNELKHGLTEDELELIKRAYYRSKHSDEASWEAEHVFYKVMAEKAQRLIKDYFPDAKAEWEKKVRRENEARGDKIHETLSEYGIEDIEVNVFAQQFLDPGYEERKLIELNNGDPIKMSRACALSRELMKDADFNYHLSSLTVHDEKSRAAYQAEVKKHGKYWDRTWALAVFKDGDELGDTSTHDLGTFNYKKAPDIRSMLLWYLIPMADQYGGFTHDKGKAEQAVKDLENCLKNAPWDEDERDEDGRTLNKSGLGKYFFGKFNDEIKRILEDLFVKPGSGTYLYFKGDLWKNGSRIIGHAHPCFHYAIA